MAEARRRWNVLEEVLSPEWLSAPAAAGVEEVGLAKQGLLWGEGCFRPRPQGPGAGTALKVGMQPQLSRPGPRLGPLALRRLCSSLKGTRGLGSVKVQERPLGEAGLEQP